MQVKRHERPGRVPQQVIVDHLRGRIITGQIISGDRLPTHEETQREFRTTRVTVQRAFDRLADEGFIRTTPKIGSFVADYLPHRHHYALALGFRHDENLSQFYVALRNEAMRFESAGRRFSIFYEIDQHTDVEDYQRLLNHVRSHRLAGLIFASSPHNIAGSPILNEPDVPRVILASTSSQDGVPAVSPSAPADFIDRALDYLASRDRKRVAMMTATDLPNSERVQVFMRAAADRGMTCRPHWVQAVSYPHGTPWANNVAQLLMQSAQRPDGLVILDDNLVEHATAGIAASGRRAPGQIEIVAHTNFPLVPPAAVPVRRLGYDARRILALCLKRLEQQRHGEAIEPATWLPPLFEDELNNKPLAEQVIYPVITGGWGKGWTTTARTAREEVSIGQPAFAAN